MRKIKDPTPLWRALLLEHRLPERYKSKIREFIVPFYVKHIHGPKKFRLLENEVIVTCLVKNGELYIKSFIEHYFSLGVKHLVFLDNGSRDKTISIGKKYKNITIFQSRLPVGEYELQFRKYLIKHFSKNRWCLWVDIDELFDYPFSHKISLKDLLNYLNKKKYTAVITQVLEMFSSKPLNKLKSKPDDKIKELYRYYDLSKIKKENYSKSNLVNIYSSKNKISNKNIKLHWGGIRKKIFDSNCLLTGHRLIFLNKKINPLTHIHFADNTKIADFTCVLYHYKFLSDFYEVALKNKKAFAENQTNYDKLIKVFKKNLKLKIKQKTSKKLKSVNDLVKNRFLVISEDYMNWIEDSKNS